EVIAYVLLCHGKGGASNRVFSSPCNKLSSRPLASSSILGKCSAGRVDRVKWLRPLLSWTRPSFRLKPIRDCSLKARQISDSFLAGTVTRPYSSTSTSSI